MLAVVVSTKSSAVLRLKLGWIQPQIQREGGGRRRGDVQGGGHLYHILCPLILFAQNPNDSRRFPGRGRRPGILPQVVRMAPQGEPSLIVFRHCNPYVFLSSPKTFFSISVNSLYLVLFHT